MVALEEKNFQITKAKSFVAMVVIVDPSLFCCVNLQAFPHDPSFSHLKHGNGSKRQTKVFLGFLGKWFI